MHLTYARLRSQAWRIGHSYGRLRALLLDLIRAVSLVALAAEKVCINWARERRREREARREGGKLGGWRVKSLRSVYSRIYDALPRLLCPWL